MHFKIPFALIVCAVSVYSVADAKSDILKQRRKGTDCKAYYDVAQHKAQLELQAPAIKLSVGKETQVVKPSDETLRLGMSMKARCEAYLSDPAMSTETYLREIHQLEDSQRIIEKQVFVGLTDDVSPHDKIDVKVIRKSENPPQ